ncbi:hypothetical protein CR513_31466, partial [Mucuna pruriens]
MAHICEFPAKTKVARRYNAISDLVLRRTLMGAATNKLMPNWEGPFRVREEVGQGAFKLEHLNGKAMARTWNSATLRKYYS